jgi:WD40 repeat protein
VIDGECLKRLKKVQTLQLLEGNHSEIRALKLEEVIEKVGQVVEDGISCERLERINKKIADRRKKKNDEAALQRIVEEANMAADGNVTMLDSIRGLWNSTNRSNFSTSGIVKTVMEVFEHSRGRSTEADGQTARNAGNESINTANEIVVSEGDVYEGHSSYILAIIISEADNWLISGSADTSIKIWSNLSHSCIATMEGHSAGVRCLAFSDKRRQLFSGSKDNTIKVWNIETFQCVSTLEGHSDWVRSLVIDESANRLYSGGRDCKIKAWDIDTYEIVSSFQGKYHKVWCLSLCSNARRLYSASHDSVIKIWKTKRSPWKSALIGRCVSTLKGHSESVVSLCLSEEAGKLFSGSVDNTIKIWEISTNTCIATLEGHSDCVTCLCFSFKTNRLISASSDKTIKVWDTTTNTCIQTVLDAHRDPIHCLALSDNDNMLYSGGGEIHGNKDFMIKSWHLISNLI